MSGRILRKLHEAEIEELGKYEEDAKRRKEIFEKEKKKEISKMIKWHGKKKYEKEYQPWKAKNKKMESSPNSVLMSLYEAEIEEMGLKEDTEDFLKYSKIHREGVGLGKSSAITKAQRWKKGSKKYKGKQMMKKVGRVARSQTEKEAKRSHKALQRTANLEEEEVNLSDLVEQYSCAKAKPTENFPGEGKKRRDDENLEILEGRKRKLRMKQKELI